VIARRPDGLRAEFVLLYLLLKSHSPENTIAAQNPCRPDRA
jgi:hypothetical protein